jgi:chemotaxis protein CheZ
MAAPRKVFRIEKSTAESHEAPQTNGSQAPRCSDVLHELAALRTLLTAAPVRQALGPAALQGDEIEQLTSVLRRMRSAIVGTEQEHVNGEGLRAPAPRIANELKAVMKGSEQAIQKILTAAEEIDQAANNLSAAIKTESEQGLAQDIRDRVIAIFEACNFQDLTCQRVAKVMAALAHIENQISHMLDELARQAAPAMHGPQLEQDHGHASQSEVDSIFSGRDAGSA